MGKKSLEIVFFRCAPVIHYGMLRTKEVKPRQLKEHGKKERASLGWPSLRRLPPTLYSIQSTTNKWERQDSNLRRKPSTDLQSAAFDHSATLPSFLPFRAEAPSERVPELNKKGDALRSEVKKRRWELPI
jgi:hypothetical protein